MGLGHSPRIVTENLVLLLDAGNPRNFDLTKVEVLVVAGGGGGGHGGGGAGGLIYNSNFAVTPGTQLTATVGNGGAGGISGTRGPTPSGSNGSNSVFGSLIAAGGGGGAGAGNVNAGDGGSGGGQGGDAHTAGRTLGTAGQGNGGGRSSRPGYGAAGGGGGAGGAGSDATEQNSTIGLGGNGGVGLQYSISGSNVFYAGGGGGGANLNSPDTTASGGGVGGAGGGGSGGLVVDSGFRSSATPNSGGGGGGAEYEGSILGGGAGGNGIIIVRYPGPQKAIGGTVTSVGGDTIHTFTTSGNFTPLVNTNGSAVLGLSDLSGNRNFVDSGGTGVLYSSANGGSLSFDGTDDYVTLSSSQIAPGTGAFTWNFWAKSTRTQQDYSILFSGAGSNTDYGVIGLNKAVGLGLLYYAGGFRIQDADISFFGNWIYVSFVGNGGGTGSRTLRLYKNGVQAGSTYTFDYNFTSTTPIIGANHSALSECMGGNIANVTYYNRALSAAEISQNFNALRGRFGL